MKEQLEKFFKSKGINKFIPQFSKLQEEQIQSIINSVYKPAFSELEEELKLYSGINASTWTSKKSLESVEDITFSVIRASKSIFKYIPKFIVENSEVKVTGQYSIPDLYEEDNKFTNTNLDKLISEVTEQDIISDFISVFIGNVDIK